jgi:hypothetical protein
MGDNFLPLAKRLWWTKKCFVLIETISPSLRKCVFDRKTMTLIFVKFKPDSIFWKNLLKIIVLNVDYKCQYDWLLLFPVYFSSAIFFGFLLY